jgi:hypothetical protein
MKKRTKSTALAIATAILNHPEVQKQVKKLAKAGFKKAQQWWSKRRSQKNKLLSQAAKLKKRRTTIRGKKQRNVRAQVNTEATHGDPKI